MDETKKTNEKIFRLFVDWGFSQKEASKYFEDLKQLSIDLNNFNETPNKPIFENILDLHAPGSTESLKKFGVA